MMDSKWWEFYGNEAMGSVDIELMTAEELYQRFAERFRRENEVVTSNMPELSNYYPIVTKDTTT